MYGKYDLLDELKAYKVKVRPASNELPYKFETGTQNHEGIAGVLGALEYFQWLGSAFGGEQSDTRAPEEHRDYPGTAHHYSPRSEAEWEGKCRERSGALAPSSRSGDAGFSDRRLLYKQAMSAIRAYEVELSKALIGVIEAVPGTRIHGLTDLDRAQLCPGDRGTNGVIRSGRDDPGGTRALQHPGGD